MFTGLVGPLGTVAQMQGEGEVRFTLDTPWPADSFVMGESIACDGACMTVVDWRATDLGTSFDFVASAESLAMTNLGTWQVGQAVNLERALKLGDALGGHLVSGHVDSLATLTDCRAENQSYRLTFEVAAEFAPLIAPKGSVTLNGVSLTVNEVSSRIFGVNIVPHTWDVTNLGRLSVGDKVNFEADTLARYVARQLEARL